MRVSTFIATVSVPADPKPDYLGQAPDLAEFVQTLSRHRVRYMVVGGHATGFHAQPRATKDLDIWLAPFEDNRRRMATALADFGAPAHLIDTIMRATENEIVWFGTPPLRIDLLQQLPGVDFEEAEARCVMARSGEQDIPVIGRDDLIRNKLAVGRQQDLADVEALRASARP